MYSLRNNNLSSYSLLIYNSLMLEMTRYMEHQRRFLVVRALAEMPQERDIPVSPSDGTEEVI